MKLRFVTHGCSFAIFCIVLGIFTACEDSDSQFSFPGPVDAEIADVEENDAGWNRETGDTENETIPIGETDPDDFWTLVVIPDTQASYYSSPSFFESEAIWISENIQKEKIAFVLHEGDIVDNNQDRNQWSAAQSILGRLDGKVPYVLSVGNHDMETIKEPLRSTNLNHYFSFESRSEQPWFGGAFQPGHLENTYHLLQGGDRTWLVISLEFSPRQAVLDWADGVLAKYPSHPAILITHAYLYSDGQRYAHMGRTCQFYGACTEPPSHRNPQCWDPTCYFSDGADGEMIWAAIGAKHSNLLFIFSGHVANPAPNDAARLSTRRPDGTVCHQIMANYQADFATGGDGYLRLLRFYKNGRVWVRTYSPFVEASRAFLTEDRNQFELYIE
jgi:hypothetical protein